MDEKFIMNIVMPDRIPEGLETVIELLRPSMLYSDQVILNCSELNELADAYNKYGEEYRAMYIEDRRDMIDSVKDALTKNPGKTIQIKGVSVSADDFLGIFMDELEESIRTLDKNDQVFKKFFRISIREKYGSRSTTAFRKRMRTARSSLIQRKLTSGISTAYLQTLLIMNIILFLTAVFLIQWTARSES